MCAMFEVVEHKKFDVKDAILIEGFPSVGMVSSIAANHLISVLKMEYVGAIYSRYLAPASIILHGVPYPPLRIYAGEPVCSEEGICEQLVVLTSEFKVPEPVTVPLTEAILDWCRDRGIERVISVEGIPTKDRSTQDLPLMGAGSTESARAFLKKMNIEPLESGLVVGISGTLLFQGARRNQDVACLLAHALSDVPDSRSAAKIIRFISKAFANIDVDPAPLLAQAEVIESSLKKVKEGTPKRTPEDFILPIYQ